MPNVLDCLAAMHYLLRMTTNNDNNNNNNTPSPAPHIVEEIAETHLNIETLETQKSDDLDFHSLSVWQIEAALEAAFKAGHELAQYEAKKNEIEKACRNLTAN